MKESGAGDKKINNTLIRKLLENDEMRDKFLTRLGEIYQVFTTDFMTELFNEMADTLEPEMNQCISTAGPRKTIKTSTAIRPPRREGALRYWHTRLDYTRNVLKKRPTYFTKWFRSGLN